jgi:lipopolysaccharide/colanic/teichoic acid biosynthesis glycosyltransferase
MFRRLFDIVFGSAVLLLASPILLMTAVAVSLDGGPVFFTQKRAGRGGGEFAILKFRSMRPHNFTTSQLIRVHGQVTDHHPDVTAVGRWIRRFKIDELPQLINVIRGDMSIIGPRPTVPEQVEEYTPYQLRRLEIRPGLTGWAQVNGGIEFTWPERILLDVWYVAHRSLWLDVRILLKTAWVILFGDSLNASALAAAVQFSRQHKYDSGVGEREYNPQLSESSLKGLRVSRNVIKDEV